MILRCTLLPPVDGCLQCKLFLLQAVILESSTLQVCYLALDNWACRIMLCIASIINAVSTRGFAIATPCTEH